MCRFMCQEQYSSVSCATVNSQSQKDLLTFLTCNIFALKLKVATWLNKHGNAVASTRNGNTAAKDDQL